MNTTSNNTGEEAVQRMLKAAYTQREDGKPIEPGIHWQMDVMRDVRRIGPLNRQGNALRIFDQFVWRFATAACAIVLCLAVYAGVTGWNPLDDLNAQFFNNPAEFAVAQAFEVYESDE